MVEPEESSRPECNGSAFVLQCQQLLEETRVDKEKRKKVILFANEICEILKKANPKGHKTNYRNLSWLNTIGVTFPLSLTKEQIDKQQTNVEEYSWIAPSKIDIIDDSSIRVEDSNEVFVRLIVPLDNILLGKRDFLNGVYHVKRVLMLCSCASILKNELKGSIVSFVCEKNNSLLPNIRVTSSNDLSIDISINGGNEWVKQDRFLPSIGNIRPSWAHGDKICIKDNEPSPLFNVILNEHLHESSLYTFIQSSLLHKPKLQDAILLIQKWVKIRRLSGMTKLFIRSWMIYLLNEGKVNEKKDMMTTLVVFIQSIAILEKGTMKSVNGNELNDSITRSTLSPITLYDPSNTINIAHSITDRYLTRIKIEASFALSCMGDLSTTNYLFYDQTPFTHLFDHYYQLDISSSLLSSYDLLVDTVSRRDKVTSFVRQLASQIENGMGERFNSYDICIINDINEDTYLDEQFNIWNTSSPISIDTNDYRILIGFDPSNDWSNPLTIGPVANSREASSFSSFWNGKSHVRKFADNRICCVMGWGDEVNENIPRIIINFILKEHWSSPSSLISWRSEIPSILLPKRSNYDRISKAYSKLGEMLRSLTDLPLSITNIHGVSSYLRGTEPDDNVLNEGKGGGLKGSCLVPIESSIPSFKPSIYVQLKLEHSGKWGEDEKAMEELMTAFHVQLAQSLKKQLSVVAFPTKEFVYAVVEEIVFRLEVLNGKLHAKMRKDLDTLKNVGATRSVIAPLQMRFDAFETKFIREQQLSSSLHGLSSAYPSFSQSIHIFKRWLGSHLMSSSLNNFTIELLVAAVFTDKKKRSIPRSGWNGFRRVLSLIHSHNWALKPLIVDISSEWNDDYKGIVENSFVKLRPILPPMVIICNEDEKGCTWTRDTPDPVLLKRLVGLAKHTHDLLINNLISTKAIDLQYSLTKESLTMFDCVLSLDSSLVSRMNNPKGKKWQSSMPVIDWDTVEILMNELNGHFSHLAYFFYNRYRPLNIGIKFKPQSDGISVSLTRCGAHKRDSSGHLIINRDEVIEGIQIIGGPLISQISRL